MKRKLGVLLVLGAMAGSSAGAESGWRYRLPETGLCPSYACLTAVTRMGERHGGSHLSLLRGALTLPLSDPRRSGVGEWCFNAQLDVEGTRVDAGGIAGLAHDDFFRLALPMSFIRPETNGNRLTLSLAPGVAADSSSFSKGWDVGAAVGYSVRCSETLRYGLGLYVSPRFAQYGIVPLFSFEWKPARDWTVSLKNYRLSAMKSLSDKLEVGPFLAGTGGVWAAETPRGSRFFRVRSLVAGVRAEYDFSRVGQTKRILEFSVGSTLATTAGFCRRNAGKDVESLHHYKPGLYLSAGVDFRF